MEEKLGNYVVWKGRFINNIINDGKYENYLELGVAAGESWYEISCKNKIGVDVYPRFNPIRQSTTDNFFISNTEKFDVIFIDACHEKIHVMNDFINSLSVLSDNGIILLHDVNPPDKNHTSQNACGNAYEFWIELCKYANTNVFNYETNNEFIGNFTDTVGIFIKSENKKFDINSINKSFNFNWDDFTVNKNEIIDSKHIIYEDLIKKIIG